MAATSIFANRFVENAIALPTQFSLRRIACIIASNISVKELISGIMAQTPQADRTRNPHMTRGDSG
jgi:hypothetical protein